MNIIRLAFELFVLYLLYKLVFEFIIPVYRATRHMKNKMEEAREKMEQESNMQRSSPKAVSEDDYIDFEEVK